PGVTDGFATSVASAINRAGDAVGHESTTDFSSEHAFFWHNGVMTDLGTLGGAYSYAYGINDSDQVVGEAGTGEVDANGNAIYHAFLWQNGVMTDLGNTLGGANSIAYGLNNAGPVVGTADTGAIDAYGLAIFDSFQWQNGVMTDLGIPTSDAAGTNDAGQIAGTAADDTDTYVAYLWQAGTTTYLPRNYDSTDGFYLP